MTPDSTLSRRLQAEEAARALSHRREADRCAGVAWSGLAPDPFHPRPAVALAQAARDRLEALHRWRASPPGRLLAAMVQAGRAVAAIRACVARGFDGDEGGRCAAALSDLQSAVDAGRAAALTAQACATNSASRPPSTG